MTVADDRVDTMIPVHPERPSEKSLEFVDADSPRRDDFEWSAGEGGRQLTLTRTSMAGPMMIQACN